MKNQILLYVSAAADLGVERDGINRAVAEIPLDIGWRILQSPLRDGPLELEVIHTADLHFLILGGDIRAPIGHEWSAALRAARLPLCLLKKGVNRTSAAEDFRRFVAQATNWVPYETVAGLENYVIDQISDYLVDRAGQIGMTPAEYDQLVAWREERDAAEADAAQAETRSTLGESSVILTQNRFRPSDGVELD